MNNIETIIAELDAISTKDVMTESVKEKLNASLKLYMTTIDKSCKALLDSNLNDVIKLINKKYKEASKNE